MGRIGRLKETHLDSQHHAAGSLVRPSTAADQNQNDMFSIEWHQRLRNGAQCIWLCDLRADDGQGKEAHRISTLARIGQNSKNRKSSTFPHAPHGVHFGK